MTATWYGLNALWGATLPADVRLNLGEGGLGGLLTALVAGALVGMPVAGTSTAAHDRPGSRTATPCGRRGRHRGAPCRVGMSALLIVGAAAFVTESTATASRVHRVLGAMTVVRFVGDAVRTRLGGPVTIRLAGGVTTAGYGLVPLAGALSSVGVAMAGWVLAGAGMVWPIVVSATRSSRPIRCIEAGPATVLGSSGGAVTALVPVEAHPELVATVIAHEPPRGSSPPGPTR